MEEPTKVRRVGLGLREVEFPSGDLEELQEDNDCLGDRNALQERMQKKGYLFIRGLHSRDEVLSARLKVLQHIRDSGEDKLKAGVPWQQGILDARCGRGCIPFMEGKTGIGHSEEVSKVLEGPRAKEFFRIFLGEEPLTFDFKWLRGVYREGFTGAHVDWVYMGWGTETLYTMWTPFDDIPVEMGTLVMCESSNWLPSFKKFQDTYGQLNLEKSGFAGTGWYTKDPYEISKQFGGQWKTSDFKAGDALIFTMKTVHMSTLNMTDKVRLSCDTRWQPASHAADTRYVGEFQKPELKYGLHSESDHAIEELKKNWGFITDSNILVN